MILPGHLASGFLMTNVLLSVIHPELSSSQTNLLLIFGTLAGDFPDIDVFYFFLKNKTTDPEKLSDHRHYFTHAPLFWLILGLCIFVLSVDPFYKLVGLLVWLGPWVHFLCDSIDFGVMWFWPFSNKRLSFIKWKEPTELTARTPWGRLLEKCSKKITFYVEILLVIIAIIVLMP
ncbi:MAG: metal-dependent hydrolase [Candidatus Taylorbacteria bacterium]|nr:metal-dependent hydrolase [Candidatus Taylorbacteria bacterium]